MKVGEVIVTEMDFGIIGLSDNSADDVIKKRSAF